MHVISCCDHCCTEIHHAIWVLPPNCSCVHIKVHNLLCRSGEPKEDAVIYMRMAFECTDAWLLDCDWGSKCSHVFEVWFMTTPSFVGGLLDRRMIRPVKDVTRVHERVAPEFHAKRAAIEEASDHIAVRSVWVFTKTI